MTYESDVLCYAASWNKYTGASILDLHPKRSPIDFDLLTMQIFFSFQNFYAQEHDIKKFRSSIFKLPIRNRRKKAVIFIGFNESLENNTISNAFMVCFLFPDFLTDDDLDKYLEIVNNCGLEFIEKEHPSIIKYYQKAVQRYEFEEKIKDSDLNLKHYSFSEALKDFEKGIKFYSANDFEKAVNFLKKTYLKFHSENNFELTIESIYFFANALVKLKKYNAATKYYKRLEEIASETGKREYIERSLYLQGLCAFKIGDYPIARENLKELYSKGYSNVDAYNFLFLFGRVLRFCGDYNYSIEILKKLKLIFNQLNDITNQNNKRARLNLELAHSYYTKAFDTIMSENKNFKLYNSSLNTSID
ncbi:MAG: hypothetical protein GF353_11730, partial [Candidatus Lokiarchaeota archaeon]|nr:hypothetical protein [Candidatus Lokiarchaeota archaeon]